MNRGYVGIECGGTHTVVLFGPGSHGDYQHAEFGPANLRLLDAAALVKHFETIKKAVVIAPSSVVGRALRARRGGQQSARPAGIVIGMAGARTEADRRRIRAAAGKVWPGVPVYATNDLETALAAAEQPNEPPSTVQVLILSGTGSCCFGRRMRTGGAKMVRLGGWGHILGDRGSGYDIGLRTLRAVISEMDRKGRWPALGGSILRVLQLNEPDDLIDWVKGAEKMEVAALAQTVFTAAAKGDPLARQVLAKAATSLAEDGANCARRLAGSGGPVEFVLAGGILLNQPGFARQLGARLRQLRPGSRVTVLARESVWGTIALAKELFDDVSSATAREAAPANTPSFLPVSAALPPTEQGNPRSRNLDTMPLSRAVALMIKEESAVGAAILKERRKIERAVEMIAHSLGRGGRLFYAGAGSSGRLGILDASECPPTFRLPPDRVQGIIAGGRTAIWKSVEGAEDDAAAGASALAHRGVNKRDVVVGIAASGRTPFVWGALAAARQRGARTILLCCNPRLEIPAAQRPDLVVAPGTGPEVLTGSTRLKAGTATKIILNIFTTLAMVRLGKVMGNLMVDLDPANEKLRARAVRMVQTLTDADAVSARSALEKTKWNVKSACQKLCRHANRQPSVRKAIVPVRAA